MVKTARGDPRVAKKHLRTISDSRLHLTQYPSSKPLGMRSHVCNQSTSIVRRDATRGRALKQDTRKLETEIQGS